MKNLYILTFALALAFTGCLSKKNNSLEHIRMNALGFKPQANKQATLITENSGFRILEASTKQTVFSGKASGPYVQTDVNQTAFIADFSKLNQEGSFVLETENGTQSEPFSIGKTVYDSAFYLAMRGFYLWRCGTAVKASYHGETFKQEACHLNDGQLTYTEFGAKFKDGTGGWHDAGDYGKYTVNAGITMGLLFLVWDNYQSKLDTFSLDLPETAAGFPDYLQELKWETDWLLKMQYPDNSGRISHKLTRLNFSDFIMPQQDTTQRFFTEWSSSATAHFVGVMAQAARYFKPYNAVYAKTCLNAAIRSYNYLAKNSEYKKWEQEQFQTGTYQTSDTDARIWAAAELFETTGEIKYAIDFETRMADIQEKVDLNWDWQNVKNLGTFTYLLSNNKGKNSELEKQLSDAVLQIADSLVFYNKKDIYGRPFNNYYWGCNGTIARLSANLMVAYKLSGNQTYKAAGQNIVAYLMGRNYYGRSFVTGLGINPPMHPHDRRSAADSIDTPWPGYLVGGGHTATDWVDEEADYARNEIAINWQASLVLSLAFAMN
jgi:endoglucanase